MTPRATPNSYLVAVGELPVAVGTFACSVGVVDITQTALSPTFWRVPETAFEPDIAGDGKDFMLSYRQTIGGMTVCRRLRADAGSIVAGAAKPIVSSATFPRISRISSSYLLMFKRGAETFATSIDAATCSSCEGEFRLGASPSFNPVAVCKTVNGRPTNRALVAWREGPVIEIQAFRADDGIVSDLGGGCAAGGEALVTCARTGNAGFTNELRDAAALSPATFVLGLAQTSFPCGPCTLMVQPAGALIVPVGTTDANGRASLAIPLPNLPGLQGAKLVEQWLVVSLNGGCAQSVGFSNALEVQIQ